MHIYDCFPFNDEIEILKMRILYLEPLVSFFVIAESNLTFSGAKKEYFADQVINSLKIDASRIIRVKYEFPVTLLNTSLQKNDRWLLERFARESLALQINKLRNDDYVILSDVDEIPSKNQIIESVKKKYISRVSTPEFYGKLNWKKNGQSPWLTVKIGPAVFFRDLNAIRYGQFPIQKGIEGAHFSDLYKKVEDIGRKANSSAHSEFDLNLNEMTSIYQYSHKYKFDHRGRFFRKGMGLIHVTDKLSEQQQLLAEIAPDFVDNTLTPSYFSRICASYMISMAWKSRPIQMRQSESVGIFLTALAHYSFLRIYDFTSKILRVVMKEMSVLLCSTYKVLLLRTRQ